MPTGRPSAGNVILFETTWGWCAARVGSGGVEVFQLPIASPRRAAVLFRERLAGDATVGHRRMGRYPWESSFPVDPSAAALVRQVREYFAGKRRRFDLKVDWTSATPFRRKVWRALGRVPCGSTLTYGDLAHGIGRPRAARAVGGAVAANPVPLIVPCHRVLPTGGGLGGFSGEGGVAMKQRLLDFEGADTDSLLCKEHAPTHWNSLQDFI